MTHGMGATNIHSESGFSLMELIVATGLLLAVSAVVTTALSQMTSSQKTIWNRTQMHGGIRGATELLQQEVGQAGLITLPAPITLQTQTVPATCDPTTPSTNAVTVRVSSVTGLFTNIKLTTLDGDESETIRVIAVNAGATPPSIQACFTRTHLAGAALAVFGGFAEGIIPPGPAYTAGPTGTYPNGSDANRLKLFGDVNSDGNLVYVEYYCDNGDAGTAGSHQFYRNVMAYNAASKPVVTSSQVLLTNVYPNPPDSGNAARPCFSYQWVTINNTSYPPDSHQYVLDVAITLTVQTEQIDPITRTHQLETKALLNVSPRNVFNTWAQAGNSLWDRVQPTPAGVTALLP